MMRWDRDRYVRVLEQNIRQGAKKNFNITSTESVTDPYSTFGTPFDFESVMHNVVLKMATQRFSPQYIPITAMGLNATKNQYEFNQQTARKLTDYCF